MPVDCTGMIASRCGPHLALLPAWRPLVPLSSSSSSSPPRRAATMREPSPPPAPPLPMRAPAPRCQRRRRAETLHCIHESRCGPHLAPLSTSRRGTTLRAPSPPPAPALPMRAPAPRCQRRAGGRKHCIAFTNHDAALTSRSCRLGAHSPRPRPRPRPRPPHCRHCDRRIPPLPRASRSKLVNDSRGK